MTLHKLENDRKKDRPPIEKVRFSTFDVMAILDVTRARLREWMDLGFVSPMTQAKGAGTKALFNLLDIYKIAVFKFLIDAGVNRRMSADIVKTSDRLNNWDDTQKIEFILLLNAEGESRFIVYEKPGPWTFDNDISERTDWEIGVLINFGKIKKDLLGNLMGN